MAKLWIFHLTRHLAPRGGFCLPWSRIAHLCIHRCSPYLMDYHYLWPVTVEQNSVCNFRTPITGTNQLRKYFTHQTDQIFQIRWATTWHGFYTLCKDGLLHLENIIGSLWVHLGCYWDRIGAIFCEWDELWMKVNELRNKYSRLPLIWLVWDLSDAELPQIPDYQVRRI